MVPSVCLSILRKYMPYIHLFFHEYNLLHSGGYAKETKTRLGLKCQTPVKVKSLPLPV